MPIVIENLQSKAIPSKRLIRIIAQKILRSEGIKSANLSLVFVTNQKIKSLNKKFLKREYVTDVLAFDLREDTSKSVRRTKVIEGDIVISVDQARVQAKQYKRSIKEELILYIVHGILHLNGYDDHKPKDAKKMRKREDELMIELARSIKKL